MMNTTKILGRHAIGMPMSSRVRVASVRALPMDTGVAPVTGQKCAFVQKNALVPTTTVSSVPFGTDVVRDGAFSGAATWRPPN